MGISEVVRELKDTDRLLKTVERLQEEGYISEDTADNISSNISRWVFESKYTLFNFAAHLVLGSVPVPIPGLGILLRDLWTLTNKCYYKIKGNKEKEKIHSWKVLGFATIPYLGFLAYTIPLKEKSEYLGYVYAEHICFMKKNKSLEEVLEGLPRIIKKVSSKLLIPSDITNYSNKKVI